MYGRLALSPYRQKALKDMFSGYIVYAVLRIGRQLPYSAFPFPSVRLLSLRLISKPLVAMVQASFISSAAHRPQQQFADYAFLCYLMICDICWGKAKDHYNDSKTSHIAVIQATGKHEDHH
jgi:hypothetical protein